MKRFTAAVALVVTAGAAVACPDASKQAQMQAEGSVASKLADAQQMSRAPAVVAAPKPAAQAPKPATASTPGTAVADTAKKAEPGG